MTSTNLQLLAEKMLSGETILILHEKMDEHDDFTDIVIQVVYRMIHCTKETQADALKELPMLLGSDASRALIPFLSSPFFEVRGLATALLYDSPLEQDEIEALRDLLGHEDKDVRSRAAELLVAGGHDELVNRDCRF